MSSSRPMTQLGIKDGTEEGVTVCSVWLGRGNNKFHSSESQILSPLLSRSMISVGNVSSALPTLELKKLESSFFTGTLRRGDVLACSISVDFSSVLSISPRTVGGKEIGFVVDAVSVL